jgi:hypothetical protein
MPTESKIDESFSATICQLTPGVFGIAGLHKPESTSRSADRTRGLFRVCQVRFSVDCIPFATNRERYPHRREEGVCRRLPESSNSTRSSSQSRCAKESRQVEVCERHAVEMTSSGVAVRDMR